MADEETGRGEALQNEDEHVSEVALRTAGAEAEPGRVADRRATLEGEVDWRDAALRLKAEMENFRKRQMRRADDEVLREKERLMRHFVGILDHLEAALAHLDAGDAVHQGVQVAYDAMLALLLREGVERIFAQDMPFDPMRHEAVAMVPARPGDREDMRVVEVTSPGYLFENRVLRPAKVVVAKRGA